LIRQISLEWDWLMAQKDCRIASGDESMIQHAILEKSGMDTRSIEISTATDQLEAFKADLVRLRAFPLLPSWLIVIGALYIVENGGLDQVDG
jgi:carbonic anhydrase